MTATVNDKHTVLPPTDLEEMLDVGRFLDGLTRPAALVGPDGQKVPLPPEAFNVLRDVVEAMRVGKAITVAPVDQVLTTQEAANFLGISRPTLVRLLEEGALPYERAAGGRHRRIRLRDVVSYQQRKRGERRAALSDLVGEASSAGLYDQNAQSYREALRQARAGLRGSTGSGSLQRGARRVRPRAHRPSGHPAASGRGGPLPAGMEWADPRRDGARTGSDAPRHAWVEGWEQLVPGIDLPDPDDRHVVPAAIQGRADLIVTAHLKDFPREVVGSFDIEVQGPDESVMNRLDLGPALAGRR